MLSGIKAKNFSKKNPLHFIFHVKQTFYAFFGFKMFEKNYLLTSLKKIKEMRKMYKIASIACLGLMLSTTNMNAQTVADFENLTLPAESYWDGSDLSGTHDNGVFASEFTSGDCIFPNVYDTSWGAPGYWLGGFAYSNMTDSVTSGFGNKYSSKAAGGDGSSNYVVGSNNSSFIINSSSQIIDFSFTNSTYAYNSMRDGDAFAKKFGGPSGNDPDWFKLTIKIYSLGNFQDSTDFYLADFRFTDNSQDYIVKDWTTIQLVNMFGIDSIYFELSSSDVGTWGMNTPAFFCMDNVEASMVIGQDEISKNNFSFYPNPTSSVLNIKHTELIESANIIDITGKVVFNTSNINKNQYTIDVADLTSGIYFVQVVSNGVPQVQKFIKQ
jgi:hypothetical protein